MVLLPPSLTFICLIFLVSPSLAADTLKGLVECMNHQECLGANRVCSHVDKQLTGQCVCRDGYIQKTEDTFACVKKVVNKAKFLHVTCSTDEDCDRNEVCMSWQYDPRLELSRKLRTRLSAGSEEPEKHQFCIDAWIIYNNHLEDLDEPRTGGGLKTDRKNFDSEEYFNEGRRPPRVRQQYIGFAEDTLLILFLVCILATLITVHRAACIRQIQDARRNTPLRHLLPIAEDRPPPYANGPSDSVDGLSSVVYSSPAPKSLTETPPPSYEEALYRQAVRMPDLEQQASTSIEQADVELGRQVNEDTTDNAADISTEIANETVSETASPNSSLQLSEEVLVAEAAGSNISDIRLEEETSKSENTEENIEDIVYTENSSVENNNAKLTEQVEEETLSKMLNCDKTTNNVV